MERCWSLKRTTCIRPRQVHLISMRCIRGSWATRWSDGKQQWKCPATISSRSRVRFSHAKCIISFSLQQCENSSEKALLRTGGAMRSTFNSKVRGCIAYGDFASQPRQRILWTTINNLSDAIAAQVNRNYIALLSAGAFSADNVAEKNGESYQNFISLMVKNCKRRSPLLRQTWETISLHRSRESIFCVLLCFVLITSRATERKNETLYIEVERFGSVAELNANTAADATLPHQVNGQECSLGWSFGSH